MSQTLELLVLLRPVEPHDDPGQPPPSGPAELRSLCKLEDVARKRHLWCPSYDDCLDTAMRSGWRSWTCERCQRFWA
jgi:hypothetical protein